MIYAPVRELVRDRIGLDPLSLGTATFPRAVAARMAARHTPTPADYARLLAADPAEWAAFVDDLVVPESWFFRGGIDYFRRLARWLHDRAAGRTVRVLSVPCSGGEEPYSLAVALLDEGVPSSAVRIDAVDLSAAQVRRAEAGRYPAFAFREPDADPRPVYFREVEPGRWELDRRVRDRVRFRTGNLLDADFLVGEPPYDLVLCRNLFIYLTDDGRRRAGANLARLLSPGGRLCLTPAEADRLPPGRFAPDGPPGQALFVRTNDPPAPRSAVLPRPARRPEVVPRTTVVVDTPPPPLSLPRPEPLRDPAVLARELADAGKLDAALAACERAVEGAPSAELFSLLGVVHLAAGRTADAEDAFRRALYLEPDHREALTHLALLCDRRGDPGPASGLRRRLARLDPETPA